MKRLFDEHEFTVKLVLYVFALFSTVLCSHLFARLSA